MNAASHSIVGIHRDILVLSAPNLSQKWYEKGFHALGPVSSQHLGDGKKFTRLVPHMGRQIRVQGRNKPEFITFVFESLKSVCEEADEHVVLHTFISPELFAKHLVSCAVVVVPKNVFCRLSTRPVLIKCTAGIFVPHNGP